MYDKELENIPNQSNQERLKILQLNTLQDFIVNQSQSHFNKIARYPTHLLHLLQKPLCLKSLQAKTATAFFNYYTSHLNSEFISEAELLKLTYV